MGLERYRAKRDFRRTGEPRGALRRPRGELSFVVQKHAASRLHYDFRLEHGGVLVSWAVPKGPSLDPSDKRLAVRVEDHPLDYADFEGLIPAGEYGSGPVIVWDRGRWIPAGDPAEGLRKGALEFRLEGEKLSGGWMLVKLRGRAADGDKSWLLIKERDAAARPAKEYRVTEARPESVKSGRTLDEVASPGAEATAARPKRSGGRAPASAEGLRVAGVPLSHPERVVFTSQGLTKLDLARYYERVAPRILPHVADRPLSVLRCPRGAGKECFFQKHGHGTFGDAVKSIEVKGPSGSASYLMVDSVAGLVSLVQMGVLELHPWGSRSDRLEQPDRLLFDLDPAPEVPWKRVVEAAFLVREFLARLELQAFLKTTGGKGLHVVVPLVRRHGWNEVKGFARAIAAQMAQAEPELYVAASSKALRKDRIFVDYLRNGRGATAVAAYSTRAWAGAPVSTPIAWEELEAGVRSASFHVGNLEQRLGRGFRDPWRAFFRLRQSLSAGALRRLGL